MRRFLLIVIALITLTTAFAQEVIPLSYTIDPQKSLNIPIILRGPSSECQVVPLTLETTYLPEEEMINVIIRNKYEKPLRKQDQYTYLWFPPLNGFTINDLSLKNHFRRNYRSSVVVEPAMRKQLSESGYAGQSLLPAFECENGQIQNQRQTDIMLSLVPEKVLVIKIKIKDVNRPVILKLNNIIPVHSRFEYPIIFNKSYLQYITDNYSITLKVAESDCYGLNSEINRYKEWTASLKADYEQLLNYLIDNKMSSASNPEVVKRKLQLLGKYETARKGIKKTDCEELEQEYNNFRKYYNKVGEGIITADSLQRMVMELDALIDDISIARNTGNGRNCRKLKESAAKFNDVDFDENLYMEIPEMKNWAKQFLERRKLLNSFKCPGGNGGGSSTGNGGGSGSGHCSIDSEKIKGATMKINNLLNEYRIKKVKNEQAFYAIVKETDTYLKTFSDACKNNKKYQTVIKQYQDAKKAYQSAVK